MEDYISREMKAWTENFRVNSKTKSGNEKVRNLYDIILKNEMSDSDYWYFGGGANDFIHYLSRFDIKDIRDLMTDIPLWTEDQKWILKDCLIHGGMQDDGHRQSKTFEYQSELLAFLFSVTDDEDIKIDIFENAEIINDGKPKPYELLIQIKAWADKQQPDSYVPGKAHYAFSEAAIQKAIR